MDPIAFADLYHYVSKTVGDTWTYFEICGKHLVRSDILHAMQAAAH